MCILMVSLMSCYHDLYIDSISIAIDISSLLFDYV